MRLQENLTDVDEQPKLTSTGTEQSTDHMKACVLTSV